MTETRKDLFGAIRMGYVIIESERHDDWLRFLDEGLGLHIASRSAGSIAARMDAHERRLIVRRGPREDFVAIGYQLRDEATLSVVLERLRALGIATEAASAEEAAFRGVRSFVRFLGPKAVSIELFVDAILSDEPLQMRTSAFVTGDGGMGHVAMTSRRPDEMQRFWEGLFDARLSDRVEDRIAGVDLDIRFLRFNARHHSLAIATTRGIHLDPIRTRVQHLNVEAATLEDLTAAYGRCRALGYEMAHEIGQHPNDKELSFYVSSPSGFEIELGWNALEVDEASWKPTTHPSISAWGHKPERSSFFSQLSLNAGNFRRGVGSLMRTEYLPTDRKGAQ